MTSDKIPTHLNYACLYYKQLEPKCQNKAPGILITALYLKGPGSQTSNYGNITKIRKTLNAATILHAKHINLKTQLFQVPHKKRIFFQVPNFIYPQIQRSYTYKTPPEINLKKLPMRNIQLDINISKC